MQDPAVDHERLLPQQVGVERPGVREAEPLGQHGELDDPRRGRVGLQDDAEVHHRPRRADALESAADRQAVGLDRHPQRVLRRVLDLRVRDRRIGLREDHHGRQQPADLGRVVQRPARYGVTVTAAGLLDGRARQLHELGMERRRRRAEYPPRLDAAVELAGRGAARVQALVEHRRERARVEVPQVEHHLGLPRDRRDHPGLGSHRADRRHTAVPDADGTDRQRGRRGGGERVAAQVHRRRARVGGLAAELDQIPLVPERAADRRGQPPGVEQHRALLDVQLEVGERAIEALAGGRRLVEIHVALRERVLQPRAVGVAQVAHVVRVERPRGGGRAEQAAAEARPLLVGPVDEPDRDRRRRPGGQRPDGAERGRDPERAVEPPARGHRVDVRADDHEPLALPSELGPDVARDVTVDGHGQLAELAQQPLAGLQPVRRPRQSAGAVGPAGQLGQLTQVGEDAVRIDHAGTATADRRTNSPCPGAVRISPRSYTSVPRQ